MAEPRDHNSRRLVQQKKYQRQHPKHILCDCHVHDRHLSGNNAPPPFNSWGFVEGLPSLFCIHPKGATPFLRCNISNLPFAAVVVAISATKAGSFPAGIATQIGFVPSNRSTEKVGDTNGTCIRQGNTDHIMLQRHHCMITGNTKMITVLYTHPPRTHVLRFVNSNLHGIWGYYQAQATVTIYNSR